MLIVRQIEEGRFMDNNKGIDKSMIHFKLQVLLGCLALSLVQVFL